MVEPNDPSSDSLTGQRVLVINDRAGVAGQLHARYPDWEIRTSQSYLSAIADVSEHPVGAVFACVEASDIELGKAVAGLRDAVGGDVRLLLCCSADAEPTTRDAMRFGADDYLICPLRVGEVEVALGARSGCAVDGGGALPCGSPLNEEGGGALPWGSPLSEEGASSSELAVLGEIVSRLDAPRDAFLSALADLLRAAFGTSSAGVVVDGAAATSGGTMSEPVMTEAVVQGDQTIGHVALGPCATDGGGALPCGSPLNDTVGALDRTKLRHYARLIGHLVTASCEHRRYHDLAYKDELSGLPNRRYLLEFLNRLLGQARLDGTTVTVLMFDVDFFKRYNDTYGHGAGDEIIRGCGELFRRNCREHDVVTRYGGDEFTVVFWDKGGTREPGSRHPSDVLPIVERFRRSLREHHFSGFDRAAGSQLTISGGLASFPTDASTVSELITRADEALLQAKREGKNRICLGGKHGGAVEDSRLRVED